MGLGAGTKGCTGHAVPTQGRRFGANPACLPPLGPRINLGGKQPLGRAKILYNKRSNNFLLPQHHHHRLLCGCSPTQGRDRHCGAAWERCSLLAAQPGVILCACLHRRGRAFRRAVGTLEPLHAVCHERPMPCRRLFLRDGLEISQ